MAKYLLVGAAALALAGGAIAQTMTEKSGNSTSTITQQGDGATKREVTKTPDGQTITQETGGSKATVVQRNAPAGGECRETADKTADGKDAKTAENKTAENKPAESGKPGVDAKTEAADAGCAKQVSEPKDFGPGFERAQALKERMDAMRRQ